MPFIRFVYCFALQPIKLLTSVSFNYKRKSSFGTSVPTWLSAPGLVYLKRHVCSSKYDLLVEEVDLVHTAPSYAVVRMPSGRETTVSLQNVEPSN